MVPKLIGYTETAKEDGCRFDFLQLERMYEMDLSMEGVDHSEVLLDEYLKEYDVNLSGYDEVRCWKGLEG